MFKVVSEENSTIVDGQDENTDVKSGKSETESNGYVTDIATGSTSSIIDVVSEEVETLFILARKLALSGQQIKSLF